MAEQESTMNDIENSDRPVIELFVKAASDKMRNGACPICHRYFLAFYILRERGLIDLVVTTFQPDLPPPEVLAFSNGKRFPLVKVHKGTIGGKDMAGMDMDTIDEIELLLDKFECENMLARKYSKDEDEAEKAFDSLIKHFNLMMKNPDSPSAGVVKILAKIDVYLKDNGTKFLLTERLGRADCYLMPILQHVRVAGKAYKDFDFPLEFRHLWFYLRDAYETDAFKESCPADGEIILHYMNKASNKPKNINKVFLMKDERTLWIPKELTSEDGATEENNGVAE